MVLQSVLAAVLIGRLFAGIVSGVNISCMNVAAETGGVLNGEPTYLEEQPVAVTK